LNEPVDVLFTVKNNEPQVVSVDLGDDRRNNFIVELVDPSGKRTTRKLDPREGAARIGQVFVEAGQSYSQHLILNDWVELPQAGRYQFTVRLSSPIQARNGVNLEVSSPKGFIEIEDNDRERLRRFCDKVSEELLSANSYAAAEHAARMLSYVRDRQAIPYLRKGFGVVYPVYAELVDGFERIGTDDAAEALLDVAIRNPQVALEAARPTLSKFAANTANADLASRIRRVLNVP
jgi:hypothetical protein